MLLSQHIKPVAKGVAVLIEYYTSHIAGKAPTSTRRVIPCPAEYAKSLVLALARKNPPVEMPYLISNIAPLIDLDEFPPQCWYQALTSDNHPRKVEFIDKAALLQAIENEQVDFWKWEPEKAERIRKQFAVSAIKQNAIPDPDLIAQGEMDGGQDA